MVVSRKSTAPLLAAGLVVFAMGSAANADISDLVFHIRAEVQTPQGLRFAEFEHRFDAQYFDPERGFYDWSLLAPVTMMASDGTIIATINGAREICNEDPDVTLNFNVSAGALSTTFTISSAVLGFATIGSPEGRASGSVNATDNNDDGVVLMPMGASGVYSAYYNNPSGPATGTTFANLMPLGAAAPFGTAFASGDFPLPPGTFIAIGAPVSDISSQFHFSLSAGDVAAGTSLFRVQVPAPGAIGLLGLAGLLVSRRRR